MRSAISEQTTRPTLRESVERLGMAAQAGPVLSSPTPGWRLIVPAVYQHRCTATLARNVLLSAAGGVPPEGGVPALTTRCVSKQSEDNHACTVLSLHSVLVAITLLVAGPRLANARNTAPR